MVNHLQPLVSIRHVFTQFPLVSISHSYPLISISIQFPLPCFRRGLSGALTIPTRIIALRILQDSPAKMGLGQYETQYFETKNAESGLTMAVKLLVYLSVSCVIPELTLRVTLRIIFEVVHHSSPSLSTSWIGG